MKKISDKKLRVSQKGFTLVELLVAVAIFTIVAMVSISALISVNDANKKAQTIRAIIDNLNFAVENMARNLRVGTNYICPSTDVGDPNCSGGADSVTFNAYNGDTVTYFLQDLGDSNYQIMKAVSTINGGEPLPITPYIAGAIYQPLSIDYLRFYVNGVGVGDGAQPRAVIVVGGTARYSDKIKSEFQIQTSVSQRLLDL